MYLHLIAKILFKEKIMKINNLRWWVVTLIALATVINYIDRQALGVLWP